MKINKIISAQINYKTRKTCKNEYLQFYGRSKTMNQKHEWVIGDNFTLIFPVKKNSINKRWRGQRNMQIYDNIINEKTVISIISKLNLKSFLVNAQMWSLVGECILDERITIQISWVCNRLFGLRFCEGKGQSWNKSQVGFCSLFGLHLCQLDE